MKNKHHLITAATIAAFGMATFGVLQGAEQVTRTTTQKNQSSSTIQSGALGQIEKATKLKGMEIIGSDNQKLGKLEDIVVDLQSEHILYGIVGSGGVAKVGEKRYAVAPEQFTQVSGNNLHAKFDKAKLESAPELTKDIDGKDQIGKADFIDRVYQHFGENAWWQGPNAPATAGRFGNAHHTSFLVGMKVKNVGDQDIGKIDNLMLNLAQGRIAYVILNPDSSLNLGDNLYALPSDTFTMSADRKFFSVDTSKEKLAAAPHFSKDNWAQLNDPNWASQVYKYYGKQAYFERGNNLQPTGRNQ